MEKKKKIYHWREKEGGEEKKMGDMKCLIETIQQKDSTKTIVTQDKETETEEKRK